MHGWISDTMDTMRVIYFITGAELIRTMFLKTYLCLALLNQLFSVFSSHATRYKSNLAAFLTQALVLH